MALKSVGRADGGNSSSWALCSFCYPYGSRGSPVLTYSIFLLTAVGGNPPPNVLRLSNNGLLGRRYLTNVRMGVYGLAVNYSTIMIF